ncbi:MAG: CPBP family intramembrane metalloprotease [Desulfobacterales bacterium]|uniref:CPBP family intramembrane metalloprotease n=1 Tax=Candidatus Desulfatibia vada TaxID=2841696 RepID=A0A8J6TPD1_9BACT|nr:CPBP family intramembrane metalloprotease [Candidatus Desulfatibia vada]
MIIPKDNAIAKAPNTVAILYRSTAGWLASALLGVTGVFSTQFLGLPNMYAAQTTMGIFGFAGGLTHYLTIKSAGGKISSERGLSLSLVVALSCAGAVTPLFLTIGTSYKMVVITFYSFAVFGALGGTAAAFAMRTAFDNASSNDVVPSVVSWSFSLGLAAFAGEIIGESLQTFLPEWLAWSFAFGALALIVGTGSGYSIVLFFRGGMEGRQVAAKNKIDYLTFSKEKNRNYLLAMVLLSVPFYLNDFSNIFIKDWRLWLLIDYTVVKTFPFLVVFWLIRNNKMQPFEFGLTSQQVIPFVTVFLIGTLAGTFIDQNGYMIMDRFPGYAPLTGMPAIENPLFKWIDLTAGLLMVGIFEELVFRGYLHTFLTRYTRNSFIIIGISSVAFGLIHWSGGLHQVIVTSAIGAVFMTLYLRTHSLPAIMLAHFTVNFIDFAGVIPKTVFRFF